MNSGSFRDKSSAVFWEVQRFSHDVGPAQSFLAPDAEWFIAVQSFMTVFHFTDREALTKHACFFLNQLISIFIW